MPDLNLQDERPLDNLEDSTEHAEGTSMAGEGTEQKGGATKIILVVLAILIVFGGGAFLLNKLGVINLFGKKKAAPQVVQLQEQAGAGQAEANTKPADAEQTPMIETPPVDQKGALAAKKEGEKDGAKKGTKEKPIQPVKEMPSPVSGGKLGEMKGEFTIQVSAWRDKEIAHEIVKRLEDAGYPAFQEERAYKDGTWFTVRVGRYASRKDAQMAVQNFAEELRTSYWIDRTQAK